MRRFYTALISNTVFANVVLLTIVALGAFSALTMTRESIPDLTIPVFEVRVPYRGADPEEVEEGVTQKIAAAVHNLEGVKNYQTTSREGVSLVSIELIEGYDEEKGRAAIQTAIDSIDSLPSGTERPRLTQASSGEQVTLVAVWGDLDERQLKGLAEEVRQELVALPDVSSVNVVGTRSFEISIEVAEEQLRKFGLSLADVSAAIRRSSNNLSAGELRLKGQEVRIRTIGRKYTGPEFESIVVKSSPQGEVITLDRVATVRDGFTEGGVYTRFNGSPCAMLRIRKAPGEDSFTIFEAVEKYAAEKELTLPEGAHITVAFDNTEFVRHLLSMIVWNGLLGLGLIVLILWLFLETRLSFWVAMGIPISLAGAMVLLILLGASINQITLIAMIIVMGIIVDDAIVVGEAIYVQRRSGKDPVEAAVAGVREVGLPVLASVATTIAAFLPMGFVAGIFGLLFQWVPIVAICALVVSLVECLFLLPAHLNHREKRIEGRGSGPTRLKRRVNAMLERFISKVYAPFVVKAVRHRYLTLCVAASVILMTQGLIAGGFIRVIMWPGVEGDNLRARVEFPPGTPFEVVRDAVIQTEQALQRVAARTETETGEPLIRYSFSAAPSGLDTVGSVEVAMLNTQDRGVGTDHIAYEWQQEIGTIPGALSQTFTGATIGVGNGEDIDVWLRGAGVATLRAASNDLQEKLRTYDGVFQISDSFRPGKMELHVTLKPEAEVLGLSLDDVSRHLFTGYYGDEVLRLQRGFEDVRVWVRYPENERKALAELERVRIRTPQGFEVPFSSVANVEYHEGLSTIQGLNGVRGVRVSAKVDRNRANPSAINENLTQTFLPRLVAKYPGVGWSLTGNEEQNRATMVSLQRGFGIALMGIFMILATVFRSYLQPFIIMLVIPFGVVGAILGHFVMGLPLSFLSIFGIIALAGVLVNDSIVLIERVNTNLGEGLSIEEALRQAGMRRFRPIMLTSLSTCAGVTPLIMGRSLDAQIVIPMAVSLAFGVAFGTILTLILTPSFLMVMNDGRRLVRRVLTGQWPTPEEVEPGTRRATKVSDSEPVPSPGDLIPVAK